MVAGLVLQWPISPDNRAALGQDYAQYNWGSANRHHTGLDIAGTTVVAAAAGTVVVRCLPPNHPGSPNVDCPVNDVNPPIDNHGMQGVVIIEHSLPGGGTVYTLYAHLGNINLTPPRGAPVATGQTLGTTGGGGNTHVHFEVKDRPVLHNPTFNNTPTPTTCNTQPPCYWGYTPATPPGTLPGLNGHPDAHGYHDPVLNLHQASALASGLRVRVTQLGQGVFTRTGPGTGYRCFQQTPLPSDGCRALNAGDDFVGLNVLATGTPGCSNGWYQILHMDGSPFPDLSRGLSTIPDAWVCRGNAGQEWVMPAPSETVGLHNPSMSTYFLRATNTAGPADATFNYGPASSGWVPLSGDWDGNGTDTVGLYNTLTATFFLRNSNSAGPSDVAPFVYGPASASWIPVVGDWDGSGTDTVGLYNPTTSTFFLRNSNTAGPADLVFSYGPAGLNWIPVVGDWDSNGTDTVGLYNPLTSTFFLRNSNTAGPAGLVFSYGPAGTNWIPVVGDWDGNGTDTVGLFNTAMATFFLRNSNSAGPADLSPFAYGPAGTNWTPLTGAWEGLIPPAIDLAGVWVGTWTSTVLPGTGGTVLVELTQAGPVIGGTVTITGSPVITTGTVFGTLAGNRITFGVINVVGTAVATFEGTFSGTTANGTYSTVPPGDAGVWQLTRI
ncbi:MAG: peptidoglycan DD-metalloendopeptidase family protein [Armatimonadota bacterium]